MKTIKRESSGDFETDHLTKATPHRPTFGQKLAALYYGLSFGYFTWCWVICIWIVSHFPLLSLPLLLYTYYICFTPHGTRPSTTATWGKPLRHWFVWKALKNYFPSATLHRTTLLPPGNKYIFIFHPHGLLAFGGFLSFVTETLGWSELFPGIDVRTLTLRLNFRAPFLREYLLLLGACDVSRDSCLKILSRGDRSVCIAVGGAAESLYSCPGKHHLVLARRKGFVKIALLTGTPLVPVYSFGETDTFHTINELSLESGIRKVLEKWQRKFEKTLGFIMPFALGNGLFFSRGILPLSVPLNIVVGAPMEVPKYEGDPDSAEFRVMVDKYHKRYVDALKKLFDNHKAKFADEDSELVLVE
jgi:1-acyl-sn-glycerol-3-phosphate acyltransferase